MDRQRNFRTGCRYEKAVLGSDRRDRRAKASYLRQGDNFNLLPLNDIEGG